MQKFIFDLITSPLSLFENPFYNYIAMAIIGIVAYKIAFSIVGKLGLRGKSGSIVHWAIRFVVFCFIWLVCCLAIVLITFVIDNWVFIIISIILLLIICILNIYAKKTPNSILNKKIF